MAFQYTYSREEMLAFLPPNARTLLDIGCETGQFGAAVRAVSPSLETWAIEPDPDAARDAVAHYDRVLPGLFPQPGVVPEGYFDVAYCNDVLEHMVEPELALRELAKVVRPDGLVVASIPNIRHVTATVPLLLRGQWTYRDEGILDRTHVRFFTRTSARRLFTDGGWRIRSVTGINRRVRLQETDRRALAMLDRLTRGRSSDFFYLQYVVVAQPPALQLS